jgi:phenylpyruvate tautomerase PptA (4-oxalocrotonate tautomerase family)
VQEQKKAAIAKGLSKAAADAGNIKSTYTEILYLLDEYQVISI